MAKNIWIDPNMGSPMPRPRSPAEKVKRLTKQLSRTELQAPDVAALTGMSDAELARAAQWAVQRGYQEMYAQVTNIQQQRSGAAQMAPGQTLSTTWNTPNVVFYDGSLPASTKKPTYKIGDKVEVTIKTDKVPKGSVGSVVKVGSKYVYVDFSGLKGSRFLSQELKVSTAAITSFNRKLDLSRVIMPDEHRSSIHEAVAQLSHNDKIFKDWGFDEILEKGKAISMLFYGPPGTGKTMCAELIATSLGKKLEVIGTGEIQSSEPGQAERNIKAYFEKSGSDTMLLFDECDSLVHSRNNTGSIMAAQINALLTALEHYEGIVVFTTNRLGVLDEAFNRRLSLKLEFPMPTQAQRLQIWKGMFPKQAPLSKDIKWHKLAELELTGGYIKNIVLRAARSAAAQGLHQIDYATLKKATRHEVMSKREFEAASRQYRSGGVTTIDEAIQDFSEDNKLEVRHGTAGTSARLGKDQKKQ